MILTFALPLGGTMLGVGLGIGQPAVWAVGIALMVAGFYGCPVAWIGYGSAVSLRRLMRAVTEEHLYTARELGMQLGISEQEARRRIATCFSKGYLVGYIRTDSGIALNENEALSKTEHTAQCPACGAKFTYTGSVAKCPYCGTPAANK